MIQSIPIPENKWLRIMYNGEGKPDTTGYILSHAPGKTNRTMVVNPMGLVIRRAKSTDPEAAHLATYRVNYCYRYTKLFKDDGSEAEEPEVVEGKWGFYADITNFYQSPNKDLIINMVNLSYLKVGGGKYYTIVLPIRYVDMYEWLEGVG